MISRLAMPRGSRRFLLGAASVSLALVTAACGMAPILGNSSATTGYAEGVVRLGEGDFSGADEAFRNSALACESGGRARRALLFLAFLHQDPRNPDGDPDTAALMAIRALLLPNPTREDRLEAEALYAAALDKGADPGLRPDPARGEFDAQFERCADLAPSDGPLVLPVLERPSSIAGEALQEENARLLDERRALALRNAELEAELERIRKLLRPDTGMVRVPRIR